MITPTRKSLDIVERITKVVPSFHHHYYIIHDIMMSYPPEQKLNYLEIGCYGGASSCLALQRPNTDVCAIDIGHPIPPEKVKHNVSLFNVHENEFFYIHQDSSSSVALDSVLNLFDGIDVLFIDGDHREKFVISDFNMYSRYVRPGGYVIFDDYLDWEHSPEVRPAVDSIVSSLKNYEIIGTLKNPFSKKEDELLSCFIVRKID